MAGVLDGLVDDLHAALTDGTTGVNAQLSDIDASAEPLGAIYRHWDAPARLVEDPALVVERDRVFTVEQSQTGKRDWVVRFHFRYKNTDADEQQREENAGWVAQAILKAIDPSTAQPTDRIPSAIQVEPIGGSTLFQRDDDGREEAVVMIADLTTREQSP